MFIDNQVMEVLDINYILERIEPQTSYGRKYKNAMKAYPPGTESYLKKELDVLEAFVKWVKERDSIGEAKNALHVVKDIRYSILRAESSSPLSEVELYEIKAFVFAVKKLQEIVHKKKLPTHPKINLYPIPELEELLNPPGENEQSFYLYDSFSESLASTRRERSRLENSLRKELRALRSKIKEEYNLSVNAEHTVILSKQDKAGIERAKSSEELNFQSETFNTIVFSLKKPMDMVAQEAEVEKLKNREFDHELRVRRELTEEIAKHTKVLKKNIHGLGNIDLFIAKAELAEKMNAVKPEIVDEHKISIVDGVYPKIAENLARDGLKFTPISIDLQEGVTCITGANMGGKTISLKIVGLLSIMAQWGLFVPAKEMIYGLNQFVRTSIGDFQSTTSGLSTFGGEIANVTYAMEMADNRGLILIDELARGTNPQEGFAISYAIADYLQDKQSITLLTTHFDEVTRLEGIRHLQVMGLNRVDLEEIKKTESQPLEKINQLMDYRLQEVSQFREVPKDAIHIAHMMGLPEEITNKAEKILEDGR